MFQVHDYQCSNEDCKNSFEIIVDAKKKDEQVCDLCGAKAERLLSFGSCYAPSKERTSAMMKKRSQDHNAWCRKKGIHPNETGDSTTSFNADPIYRNKTRAKNTSRQTVERFRNAHKGWEPT